MISRDDRHATMKQSSSIFRENSEKKSERWMIMNIGRSSPFFLSSFCITLFFTGFFVYQNPFKSIADQNVLSLQPQIGKVKPNKTENMINKICEYMDYF